MSESFSDPVGDSSTDRADRADRSASGTAEPDVEANDDQVEPADGSEYVGRVAGDDLGYADEQGAEARAAEGDGKG